MAEPRADHTEIDVGLQQMGRRCVPPGMGRDFPGQQRRTTFGRFGNSMRNNMAKPKARKPIAFDIHEKRCGFVDANPTFDEIGFD